MLGREVAKVAGLIRSGRLVIDFAVLAALTALAVAQSGFEVWLIRIPASCSGRPCEAVLAEAHMPYVARINIEATGPEPGIYYAPDRPSSYFVRLG